MAMTQEIESEVLEMCNLSQGILERGIEQGERNAQRKVVLNLARRGMLTADIAEAVMVSEQQVREWIGERENKT